MGDCLTLQRQGTPNFPPGYALERCAWPARRCPSTARAWMLDPLSFRGTGEADLLFQTGQLKTAEDLYEKVIHDEPADCPCLFGAG